MDKLTILWTSDNKDTFMNVVASYIQGSKSNEWWKDIKLMIWGAPVKLVGEDSQIQAELLEIIGLGVKVEVCKRCCIQYELTELFEKLGASQEMLGPIVTAQLKSDEKILTI